MLLGTKRIERSGEEICIYVIAEIGQNHQGDVEIAKEMIWEAKAAGCDCVKFQKSDLTAKFTKSALNRIYDSDNSWGKTYGEHKRYLEFSFDQYRELQKYCKDVKIDFTASAMDEISLEQLDLLDVPFIKIGSGDANNFPMLEKAAKLKRPLIISTGMQSMTTIEKIVEIMEREKKSNYALLHCVSAYPTEPENCNLQMIPILRKKFPNIVIGYSGHEVGVEITEAAVLLGARIVERHFTLNKQQKGSDHKCSLEPNELTQLIQKINALKEKEFLKKIDYTKDDILGLFENKETLVKALGVVTEKVILRCELSCKKKLGKSIVSSKTLKTGHKLNSEDIRIKVSEPNGIPAENLYTILGRKLNCDIKEDSPIMYSHLE